MSSAKTRLFLTIEKLKNIMEDGQMTYPFWEKFFPLLGNNTNVITIDVTTLGDLINEAAETADQLIVTQGGVMYSQYLQNPTDPMMTATTTNQSPSFYRRLLLNNTSAGNVTTPSTIVLDMKQYHSYAEKIATYFVSASVSSTVFTVKDIVKLYLFISQKPKLQPLFKLMEQLLFKTPKTCIPTVDANTKSFVLDNLRDLTTMTNYRLDNESLVLMLTNLQYALNNELCKYPNVRVREYISDLNVYDNEVQPSKAFADKFKLLVTLKPTHCISGGNKNALFRSSTLTNIESVAAEMERNCNMYRMVYNSINNIFINAVEQSAAENIKFDIKDYNKRFVVLERVRENSRNNVVDKLVVGDVNGRKRTQTIDKTLTTQNNKRRTIYNK
ncbi:BV/ODV-C42 [Cnaphalocrocis medinalis granulovirus]|uniref:p40 n=1 Tax=Cnaphalocrocis medinalis granulovirus TaxID=1750712 RepID=A0A109WW75_9BBAC|nr:BV/ODV-C42 [Cnaphalocrocis medinalis granulovirus]ALN42007.1 p40 [Cnaphalocrocis medinalis granulovirus]AMF83819.1 BV/ODV-C42 [Cnaphalocrocis medinalis granulovirus]WPN08697.1 BV/ODV-C42 [Cnaphalocrocis medinalis granulovirus]